MPRPCPLSRAAALVLILIPVLAGVAGCATPVRPAPPPAPAPAPEPTPAPAARAAAAPCAPGPELPAAWLAPGRTVLFGDWHGTEELPAFFGEAVCRVAAGGLPVLVGLELPRDEQARVERFLATGDEREASAALLEGRFWRREYQDGRSSQAMAALLGRLRQLRRAGLPIDLLLFDVPQEATAPDRDLKMAGELAAWAHARSETLLMVQAGNFHTRTTVGAPWDPKAEPMGWYLRKAGLRVKALDCGGPQGTAWSCPGAAASSCGVQTVDLAGPAGGAPALELFPEESKAGYAGRYLVPHLGASPPAVAGAGGR